LVEPKNVESQTIVQGPIASQVAVKMLGVNGGGFTNANASHPYENPTPLSNFVQIFSIFLIPAGLTGYLGRMVKNRRHGWSVCGAMTVLFLAGLLLCWWAEGSGNPRLQALGVDSAGETWRGRRSGSGSFPPPCSPP
ncbi:MAG TPA: potassium-transporting ATPase subunit KdpA, partial [Candidatus Deferrimicrobiaceae bacterium]|nr:potassium-transporting ATPase subunit KdpA [Candidatus Deferrimicrobiaceae bacterium]